MARMRTPVLAGVVLVAVVASLAAVALGQQAPRSQRVLHEDLPALGAERPNPLVGATGSAGKPGNPAAFTAGDKMLPKPVVSAPGPTPPKGEPVLGAGGFAADRQTSMTPDTNTGPDATLHYVSVFNPDVLPFKRMSALDTAADNYQLSVRRTARVEVPVGGTTDKTRDRFWGSVLVELAPGREAPLPSVAPDMRILSYEIKPAIRLAFSKDGADNFFVRSDDAAARGTYRLVFLADADAGYFAPSLPARRRLTVGELAAQVPSELRPQLPDGVRRAAARTLDKLDVDASMELGAAFNKLVMYFRAFEAKPIPATSGDIYRDLCDSQAGVCRHRAFAFMVTANALGIPTRFVVNEAHAFCEVWFPERGWQRLDLGGAALRMEVTGADNKTLHRPRAPDPFAQPAAYRDNYTQLEGDVAGLTQQQLSDKRAPLSQSPASGDFSAAPNAAGDGSGDADDPRITPDPTLPTVTQDPKKQTPKLAITQADASAYRGDVIHIVGKVEVAGKPLADHPVDVFLSPAGKNGASALPLGRAVTGPNGNFAQDFSVPGQIALQRYELWLSSPSDAYYNAALSD